jgi:hypothetical protein
MQALRVRDWVEVEEDLSVGLCSEGGAGMVVNIVDGRADVKYIMGGRTEKNVSKQRMVVISMPYRGVKATTRTASASHKPKAVTQTTSPEVRSHPFNKMTNAVQRLKFGLQTVGNNPSRKHEKEGWMRGELIKAGMWDRDKKKT